MAFDGFHGCAVCCGVAKVLKDVATGSDSRTPRFVFFGTIIDCVSWVCYFFAGWDVVAVDPFEDVNAVNVTVALE